MALKKGRTQAGQSKDQNEAQEYLLGWKKGRTQLGSVQRLEAGLGSVCKCLAQGLDQSSSGSVLRMNKGKEKTTQSDVKPWESCLEILSVLTHSESSGPKSGGSDVLNMPPTVGKIWGV